MAFYSQIANRSLERIGALSDGLFAIAMTLIVLEIRVPQLTDHSDLGLLAALGTYPAIAWIVLVQLNYAVAPRIGFLHRL